MLTYHAGRPDNLDGTPIKMVAAGDESRNVVVALKSRGRSLSVYENSDRRR